MRWCPCLVIVLLLNASYDSLSQSYHPFPDSNAVWREYGVDDPINLPDLFYINEYFIKGDTLINGLLYKKVGFYSISSISGDTSASNDQFFYRQDTINKKVYIQNLFYPFNDTLVYDFNLEVGDTLSDMLYLPPENSVDYFVWIDSIDTILTPNGSLKRFWLFSTATWWGYGYWIEGIGNINGFFGPPIYLPGDIYRQIFCFRKNDTIIYSAPITDVFDEIVSEADCDSVYVNVPPLSDLLSQNPIEVNPNLLRFGESLSIRSNFREPISIAIVDVFGRSLLTVEIKPDCAEVIQLNTPGIYIVYTINVKPETTSIKIVVSQ